MPVGDLPGAMVPDRAGRGGCRKQDAVLAYRDVGRERPRRIGGARGRNRTGTPLTEARDFKSLVSTNFTTRAVSLCQQILRQPLSETRASHD